VVVGQQEVHPFLGIFSRPRNSDNALDLDRHREEIADAERMQAPTVADLHVTEFNARIPFGMGVGRCM